MGKLAFMAMITGGAGFVLSFFGFLGGVPYAGALGGNQWLILFVAGVIGSLLTRRPSD